MTTAERWSTGLSIIALLVSIASPIAGYYLLDTKIKEAKDKQIIYSVDAFGEVTPELKTLPSRGMVLIGLANVGNLPTKDITITFAMKPSIANGKPNLHVVIAPPMPFDVSYDENNTFIHLNQVLGPKDRLGLRVQMESEGQFANLNWIDKVWVSSEVGLASLVQSNWSSGGGSSASY